MLLALVYHYFLCNKSYSKVYKLLFLLHIYRLFQSDVGTVEKTQIAFKAVFKDKKTMPRVERMLMATMLSLPSQSTRLLALLTL